MEEQTGLRCGEANPNQRLGGTSGQRPNADSQRQPDKEPTTPRGAEGEKRTQTAEERRREGWRDSRGSAATRPTLTRDWGGPQGKRPNADSQRQPYKRPTTDKRAAGPGKGETVSRKGVDLRCGEANPNQRLGGT